MDRIRNRKKRNLTGLTGWKQKETESDGIDRMDRIGNRRKRKRTERRTAGPFSIIPIRLRFLSLPFSRTPFGPVEASSRSPSSYPPSVCFFPFPILSILLILSVFSFCSPSSCACFFPFLILSILLILSVFSFCCPSSCVCFFPFLILSILLILSVFSLCSSLAVFLSAVSCFLSRLSRQGTVLLRIPPRLVCRPTDWPSSKVVF